MDPIKLNFLKGVVGEDGASALQKAGERSERLENAIVPRTILAWLNSRSKDGGYEGEVPGICNTYIRFAKGERGYNGALSVGCEPAYEFKGVSLYHIAASLAVAIGANEEFDPSIRSNDIARLGKSIDLLVKAKSLIHRMNELKKFESVSDQEGEYSREKHDRINQERTARMQSFHFDCLNKAAKKMSGNVYYHISSVPIHESVKGGPGVATLTPRIPRFPYEGFIGEPSPYRKMGPIEDVVTPRVCFANHPLDCFTAIGDQGGQVYATEALPGFHDPTEHSRRTLDPHLANAYHTGQVNDPSQFPKGYKGLVPDSVVTGEVWATKPVKVFHIGEWSSHGFTPAPHAPKHLLPKDVKSSMKKSDDTDHAKALETTGFWGKQGAGAVIMSRKTGRLLLPHRSQHVEQPGTWGTWGGAIDGKEKPADAAMRELREEAGYQGKADVHHVWTFEHPSGFKYHNHLAIVDDEFEPKLNWETQGYQWVKPGQWPENLHPGLAALIQRPEFQKMVGANPTQKAETDSKPAKGQAHMPTDAQAPMAPAGQTKQIRQPKRTIAVNKNQSEHKCEICGRANFVQGQFKGCTCLSGLSKSVKATSFRDGYILEFGPDLDADSIMTIVDALSGE